MRARPVPVLLMSALLVAGLAGVASPAADRSGNLPETPASANERFTPAWNGTDLLTREELFAAIGEDASGHAATLFYVAENGTWYHASANGSVGSPAPDGAEHPRTVDVHEVPPDDRPEYVWKVVSDDGCDVTFYDATNVSDAAAAPVPSCPPPTPPTATPSTGERTTTGSGSEPGTDTTSGGPLPGFGVAVSAVAVLLAGRFVAGG